MNPRNSTQTFEQTLHRVAEECFGELAFMLIVPEEFGERPAESAWTHAAMVDFTGPFGGQLFVAISDEMLAPLASNMLGLDPGEQAPEGVDPVDALKELLNVICGNLLPALAGDEVVFHIGAPMLLESPTLPESAPGRQFAGQTDLLLDEGQACLKLFVDEGTTLPDGN